MPKTRRYVRQKGKEADTTTVYENQVLNLANL